MTETETETALVDLGLIRIPIPTSGNYCRLLDSPDYRFDPIEQFPDELVLYPYQHSGASV